MKRFPPELEAMLSPKGRRVLAGKDRELSGVLGRDGIVFITGLLDPKVVRAAPALFHRTFDDLMFTLEKKVPPAETASEVNGAERLHKTVRSRTTSNDPREPQFQRAMECGLVPLLLSESYRRFAETLAGQRVVGPSATQLLYNGAGDYAGPHTDHQPQDRWAQHGYFDFHFTFCTPGVKRQLLVYEQDGDLNRVQEVAVPGLLTAYRLPRWHYTTPLEVTKQSARRYILMNGFYLAEHSPESDPLPAR